MCLATQVSIIEDSACRVRIILTCLLDTVDPSTIPCHHQGEVCQFLQEMRVDWTDGYVMEQGVWLLGGHLPVMGFGLVQVEKTTSTMSIVFSNTGKYNLDSVNGL